MIAVPPGREPVTGGGGKVDGGITRGTLEGRTGAGTVATGGGGGKGVLLPKFAGNCGFGAAVPVGGKGSVGKGWGILALLGSVVKSLLANSCC